MKILEIIPQLSSGGAERFTVDLCNELCINGHDVTLITFHSLTEHGFYSDDINPQVNIISLDKKFGLDVNTLKRLFNIIERNEPEVVHMHLRAIMYVFWIALFKRKIKYIHTVHSAAKAEAGGLLSSLLRKIAFKWKFICPVTISTNSHKSFVDYYGIDAPLINNGRNIDTYMKVSEDVKMELSRYRRTPNTRFVVQLARFDSVKRQDIMARVAKRLQDEGYDFAILMIGRTIEPMKSDVENVGCDCVHILGERSNPLEYLKAAGAYGLCSSYEGLPISLIEALGVGAIPICTPVGGIVNIIENNKNGFLAADTSEQAYYNTMKQYLNMSNGQLDMIKCNVIKSYSPFTMNECAFKYLNQFKKKDYTAK